ncbi:MAG: hypothetical protein ACRC0L_00160, partial [Angustibacter sp.]
MRTPRAALALARAEAVRIVRHPLILASLAGIAALWAYDLAAPGGAESFPVVSVEVELMQLQLLLVGASAFLIANLTRLRPNRFKALAQEAVAPIPAWQRTFALLLATAIPAGLALLLSLLRIVYIAAQPTAAGPVPVAEVLAIPTVTLLAAALGVVVARARSVLVGTLALALAAMSIFIGNFVLTDNKRWLLPLVFDEDSELRPLPASLLARPSNAHLGYLLGIAAAIWLLLLITHGLRHRLATIAAMSAIALAATCGAVQLQSTPRIAQASWQGARSAPAGLQQCQDRDSVQYCYFPDFSKWVPSWAQVAQGQLRVVGEQPARLVIRQRISQEIQFGPITAAWQPWAESDQTAGTPDAVSVGTSWGSDGLSYTEAQSMMGLSAGLAARLIDGPGPLNQEHRCGATGTLLAWLAIGATRDTQAAFSVLQ